MVERSQTPSVNPSFQLKKIAPLAFVLLIVINKSSFAVDVKTWITIGLILTQLTLIVIYRKQIKRSSWILFIIAMIATVAQGIYYYYQV